MASILRIKRSQVSGNPPILAAGELAYSGLADNGSNGGDRLYVGLGTETSGNAANHIVIGGKYFTDMLDHTRGTLTANSALLVDSNKKLDDLLVDNLELNGNTLSTTDTNGDLTLLPNGTGKVSIAGAYTLPRVDGTATYVLTTDGLGVVSWAAPSTALTVAADTGTADAVSLLTDTLTFEGGAGITTTVSNNKITIDGDNATSSTKGIASFNSTDFTVTAGAVTLNAERVEDIVGAMVSNNSESGIAVTYDDTASTLNFDVADFTLTIAGDVDGSATVTNLASTTINVTLDTVNSSPGTYGSATYVPAITVNAKGLVTAVSTYAISSTLTVGADNGTPVGVSLLSGSLSIVGGTGITTTVTADTVTVEGVNATTSVKGVASFATANFTVTSGAVAAKSITLGTSTLSLGSTTSSIAGLTQLDSGNLRVSGNTIAATNVNGNVVLNPIGTGTVDISSTRITNVADPVGAQDAATKNYVDTVAQGLHVHAPVTVATTASLATLTGGTVLYNNGTVGVGATLTLSVALTTVDGHTLVDGDRILVKDEANQSRNGVYTWATGGTVLTRALDMDVSADVSGGDFMFVVSGTLLGDTGWVQTEVVTTLGSSNIIFQQFSGAGTYLAGDGVTLVGSTFNVNVASTGGIELSANSLQLKSTVAGNGLTLTSGVLAIGGTTNRISVSADAIDISSSYVGQASITTLGTISTGTWSADTITTTKGGTGITTYAAYDLLVGTLAGGLTKLPMGTAGQLLQVNAAGDGLEYAEFDGGTY